MLKVTPRGTMMDSAFLLIALIFGVWILNLQGRVRALEGRIATLIERLGAVDMPARATKKEGAARLQSSVPISKAKTSRQPASIKGGTIAPAEAPPEATRAPFMPAAPTNSNSAKREAPQSARASSQRFDFEELIGGKLPIWVGGIALVFAGFFLVRYTIDAGLLGPGVRSVLAAIFALLLVAMSAFGGRMPKVGHSFAADPRIAQSLAGAGIAILYGTLYMAAEIYGLFGAPIAFGLLIGLTFLAFLLALRHGPPTALMGLVGGFAAPWVAGLGPDTVPLLLLYLGVFLTGLFGLALWRGWLWLLLLASGGGALWTIALILTAESALPLVGLFILVTGAVAVLLADRFADADQRLAQIARYAPMALALVQLAMLLPRLQFGWTGWGLYIALSAGAVALAWRDARHLPNVFGALLVSALPMLAGWDGGSNHGWLAAVSVGIGLLFAVPAHLRARGTAAYRPYWAMVALMAQAIPFGAAFFALSLRHDTVLPDWGWALISAALILPAVAIAFQWRVAPRQIDQIVQTSSAALAAAMGWLALMLVLPDDYFATSTIIIAAALAAWAARCDGDGVRRLAIIPAAIGILLLAVGSWRFYDALGDSLVGEQLMFSRLPLLGDAMAMTLIPALLLGAIAGLGWFRLGARTRAMVWAAALTGSFAFIWLLAKQPLAIDSPSQFISYGLAERVAITQLLFAAGWALLRWPARNAALNRRLGLAASAIALFRLMWFDLAVFNPLWVPQALGPAPIANMGTLHLALAALWSWLLAAKVGGSLTLFSRIGSLLLMALTGLITVRQLVQGNLVSGAVIGTGENYLYSAVLLALAIGWLAIGIKTGMALLRTAGLALLTVVTFKVFLIDAAALQGVLRILSFLGLGMALIGIGWAYGRVISPNKETATPVSP